MITKMIRDGRGASHGFTVSLFKQCPPKPASICSHHCSPHTKLIYSEKCLGWLSLSRGWTGFFFFFQRHAHFFPIILTKARPGQNTVARCKFNTACMCCLQAPAQRSRLETSSSDGRGLLLQGRRRCLFSDLFCVTEMCMDLKWWS